MLYLSPFLTAEKWADRKILFKKTLMLINDNSQSQGQVLSNAMYQKAVQAQGVTKQLYPEANTLFH